MRLIIAFLLCTGGFAQVAPTANALSQDVTYRILFREIAAYQAQADALSVQAKPEEAIRSFHKGLFELTPDKADLLTRTAVECVNKINALDLQAAAIIDAAKKEYRNVPKGPGSAVPPAPKVLEDLEAQRRAVVLDALNRITVGYGPADFAYFDNLVRRHIGAGLKVNPRPVRFK